MTSDEKRKFDIMCTPIDELSGIDTRYHAKIEALENEIKQLRHEWEQALVSTVFRVTNERLIEAGLSPLVTKEHFDSLTS